MTEMNKATGSEPAELSFEEAIDKLEQVVRQLENSELSLDASLDAFREGTELARLCRKKLDEVQQSIKQLVSAENGELVEEVFPESEA